MVTSWIARVSPQEWGLALALIVPLALGLARLTAWASLIGPLELQAQLLHTEIAALPVFAPESRRLTQEFVRLNRILKRREGRAKRRSRRLDLHRCIVLFSWLLPLFLAPTLGQASLNAVILTMLWYFASTDIDHGHISERVLLSLGLVLAWITLVCPRVAWTTPGLALLGITAILMLVGIATSLVRWRHARRAGAPGIPFGDGDVLMLMVLACYLGTDVLLLTIWACLAMMFFTWQGARFQRGLLRCGQYPMRMGRDLPFLPGLYAGTIPLLVCHAAGLSFNPMADFLLLHLRLGALL